MGAYAARQVARPGRVLLLTLNLLVQTVAAWREEDRAGRTVAVCSLRTDAEPDAVGMRCSTDPQQLMGRLAVQDE